MTEREVLDKWTSSPDIAQKIAEDHRIRQRMDVAAREEAMRLCPECRRGEHRNPPNGSAVCRCDDRRCACIVAGVSMTDLLR